MYKKKHSVSHLKKTGTPLENSQHSAPLPHHYLQGGREVLHSMTTRGKCKHKKNDRHHLGKLPQISGRFLKGQSLKQHLNLKSTSSEATWRFPLKMWNTNGNSSAVLSPGKKKIPPGIFNFFKPRKNDSSRKNSKKPLFNSLAICRFATQKFRIFENVEPFLV